MGKAANCIKMLQILSIGKVFKISELAELLKTNPRNVIEYKEEINSLFDDVDGISRPVIIPVYGKNGGYVLNGDACLPFVKLTETEKQNIVDGNKYLLSRNDFLNREKYIEAMGKILSSIRSDGFDDETDAFLINRFPLVLKQKELQEIFLKLRKAITLKHKIHFMYHANTNNIKPHYFDPYELFMFNNSWYVIGWLDSEHHPDICWFKINRMSDIQITKQSFRIWKNYKRSDYLDEFGFKTNGKWYDLEFIASGTYASLVQERVYGKNQTVEVIDKDNTRVKVSMQNEEQILAFILGFGNKITIIKPQWLIDKVKETSALVLEKYK